MDYSTPGLPVHYQLLELTQLSPSSRWCHPAISSFVVPFSSCPQSVPASESFPMSQLFTWGGQSTGELTHWKTPWWWEGLVAGGEGDYREWDGWLASLTRWTWVWVNSGSWLWTGRPAAAAKSLQSCLTLWDPIDGSLPGSLVPGVLQARVLEWVAISFSNGWKLRGSRSVVPGVLPFMGSQSWTRLSDWTELNCNNSLVCSLCSQTLSGPLLCIVSKPLHPEHWPIAPLTVSSALWWGLCLWIM